MGMRKGVEITFRLNGLCGANGGGSVQASAVRLGSHSNNLCGVHKDSLSCTPGRYAWRARYKGQGDQGPETTSLGQELASCRTEQEE
jgi:hypothetical protein